MCWSLSIQSESLGLAHMQHEEFTQEHEYLQGGSLSFLSPQNTSHFLKCYINGLIQYTLLCLALTAAILSFIHLFWVSVTHFFSCWVVFHCRIPTMCVFIQLLICMWVFSNFWLLWREFLLAFIYKYFYKNIFPLLLGKYLKVEWLNKTVDWCLT